MESQRGGIFLQTAFTPVFPQKQAFFYAIQCRKEKKLQEKYPFLKQQNAVFLKKRNKVVQRRKKCRQVKMPKDRL